MSVRKVQKLVAVALLGLFMVPLSYAEGIKIGVLNMQELNKSPQAKALQESMSEEFKPRQEKIIDKEKMLRNLHETYKRDAEVLSEKEKLAKERELNALQQEYQIMVQDLNIDFKRKESIENEKYSKQVDEVVKQIAAQDKFDLIIPRQLSLYNKNYLDVTSKVLKALEQKAQSKGV